MNQVKKTGWAAVVVGAGLLLYAAVDARAEDKEGSAHAVFSGSNERAEGKLVPIPNDESAFEGFDVLMRNAEGSMKPNVIEPNMKEKEFSYKGKKLKAMWGKKGDGSLEKAKILKAKELNAVEGGNKQLENLLCKVPQGGAGSGSQGASLIIEIVEPGSMGQGATTRIIIHGDGASVVSGADAAGTAGR